MDTLERDNVSKPESQHTSLSSLASEATVKERSSEEKPNRNQKLYCSEEITEKCLIIDPNKLKLVQDKFIQRSYYFNCFHIRFEKAFYRLRQVNSSDYNAFSQWHFNAKTDIWTPISCFGMGIGEYCNKPSCEVKCNVTEIVMRFEAMFPNSRFF